MNAVLHILDVEKATGNISQWFSRLTFQWISSFVVNHLSQLFLGFPPTPYYEKTFQLGNTQSWNSKFEPVGLQLAQVNLRAASKGAAQTFTDFCSFFFFSS